VNPRTGRAQRTYKVAHGMNEVFMVSPSPGGVGVGVVAGDCEVTDLIALSDTGRSRTAPPPHPATLNDGRMRTHPRSPRSGGRAQRTPPSESRKIPREVDRGHSVAFRRL
jgi:hypothetical protein